MGTITATTINYSTLTSASYPYNTISFASTLIGSTIYNSTLITNVGLYSTLVGSTITTNGLSITSNNIIFGLSSISQNNAGINAIALGSQAGQTNQGQNAVAIGRQAGQTNQNVSSIIFNATGSIVSSATTGFYVAPVAPIAGGAAYASILGYGLDNQVVQSNGAVVMLANGYMGVGTTQPTSILQVNGTISATSKTFDIPHPLYPDTKHLVHSSVEGPRCDLMYRGVTTLVNGTAQVNINTQCTYYHTDAMDEGNFEVLCNNPQIFLQNLTGFTRIKGSITDAILTITANDTEATDTISWLVIAERKDPYIKEWNRTDDNGFLITQYDLS